MSSGKPRFVVATHGHCFDGLCSAVVFTELAERMGIDATFEYVACGYGPAENGVAPGVLSGDYNAVLDYRFSSDPALTWYFDHHVSAFPTAHERAVYDAGSTLEPRRFFHDGAYSSCTRLIADVAKDRLRVDLSRFDELVRWADVIDAARFPSAEMAVARLEPALQLMTVVEHHGDAPTISKMVEQLRTRTLADVAASDEVIAAYAPLRDGNDRFVDLVKSRAEDRGEVVVVDLLGETIDVAAKFVTYALFPKSAYSVTLTRSPSKTKISVGYNPWSPIPRRHDIARICERYGGGGHPVVGAVSCKADEVDRTRTIASEIVTALESAGT